MIFPCVACSWAPQSRQRHQQHLPMPVLTQLRQTIDRKAELTISHINNSHIEQLTLKFDLQENTEVVAKEIKIVT
jgi:hypothetical protein